MLDLHSYDWGQSARTYIPTRVIDTAVMTQQNLTRLNLSSIYLRLYYLNSRLLMLNVSLSMVAHAPIGLPQAAHAIAQSHTRGPGFGSFVVIRAVMQYATRRISSRREPVRGPSFGILFTGRLEVIHRRRLADARG